MGHTGEPLFSGRRGTLPRKAVMTRYEDAKHCYTVAVLLYCGEKTRAGTLGTLPMHLLTLSELMY